jgi:hypothetical protein
MPILLLPTEVLIEAIPPLIEADTEVIPTRMLVPAMMLALLMEIPMVAHLQAMPLLPIMDIQTIALTHTVSYIDTQGCNRRVLLALA